MLCKKCGAEIADDAQVCEFCSNLVDKTDINEVHANNEKNRQNQLNKLMEEKAQQLSKIQERRDSKRAKQRRNKILLIIALCVLGLGLAGIGAYYVSEQAVTSQLPTPSPKVVATIAPQPTPSVTPEVTPTAEVATPTPDTGSWTATGADTGNSNANGTGNAPASNVTANTGSGTVSSANNAVAVKPSSGATTPKTVVSSAKSSGIRTNSLTSEYAVGGEVINTDGKWYMTFVSGNVKYYANVNPGATTDQVKNINYTLTAVPTEVVYNGNTVYEITEMSKHLASDYIIPESGTRLITKADVAGLSKDKLAYARNEIYARHGRRFKTDIYQQYFESKSWYQENPGYNYADDNSNLNSIEIENVKLIIDAER